MIIRFVFGLFFGSFLNVIGTRYKEDEFLLSKNTLGGRSHCPHCGKTLPWYELIPLVSFIIQRGRCRSCKGSISFQYPLVELISASIFAFVPLVSGDNIRYSSFWICIFLILLLMSIIDFRLHIIPDELNILLFISGLALLAFNIPSDFSGPFAMLFGFEGNRFANHLLSAGVLGTFFGLVILITKGKGMGMGDLKLAVPLGLVFGWPGGFIISILSFIIGAIFGIALIALKKKNRRGHLPFGPFLALGSASFFFFGEKILSFYFEFLAGLSLRLFGI